MCNAFNLATIILMCVIYQHI